jgi:hypothetical protein
MGLAGSVAGPLFNLLIGLGASLIKLTIQEGGAVKFNLFSDRRDWIIVAAIAVLFLNLLHLLIHSIFVKFKLNRVVAVIGYLFYILFLGVIIFFVFVLKYD